MTDDAQAAWDACMNTLHQEAAGLFQATVVMQEDLPGIRWHAESGDLLARYVQQAVDQLTAAVASAPRWQPQTCCVCPQSLRRRKFSIGIVMPHGLPTPTGALVFGICERCGPDLATAEQAAWRATEKLWPEQRVLGLVHEAGNA